MYLFLLYLVVYCVNGVDLWDPSSFESKERAAETAKLLNIVNKADNFKVIYISTSGDDDKQEGEDDTAIFDSMKVLQKTYDTYRKYNEFIDKANVQYISNPEILEDYKKLPKKLSERHEMNNENSPLEVPDRFNNIHSSKVMKNSRKHYKRQKKTYAAKETSDLDSKNSEDSDDDEKIKEGYIRRNLGEEKDDEDSEIASDNSKEIKDVTLKPMQEFNEAKLVKVREKQSRRRKTDMKLNVLNKIILPDENINKKPAKIKKTSTKNNRKESWDSETKHGFTVQLKKRFKIKKTSKDSEKKTSNEQQGKHNKNNLLKRHTNEETNTKKNRSTSSTTSKKYLQYSTITTERYQSEEAESNIDKSVKNEPIHSSSKSKSNKKQNNHRLVTTDTKYEKYLRQSNENKNKRKSVASKVESRVSMNEQAIEWEYGEKKKNNERTSEYRDTNFGKESIKRKKETTWDKLENNRNDNIGSKYDSEEKPKIKQKKQSDDWNKKQNDWDKKSDNYDKPFNNGNKKYGRDRKDDTWDKKDDSRSKERDTNKKDDSWSNRDDDTGLNMGGMRNKGNAQWGNYNLFKNLRDKKNSKETDVNAKETARLPKINIGPSKHSSWESIAPKRDNNYVKPKKMLRTFTRTQIPIVGKRPVYDEK